MIRGWDDAPIEAVQLSATPKPVTFIYPYYENPLFLAKQLYEWSRFPTAIKENISAIIVDDGSPDNPAERVVKGLGGYKPFPVRLFRIEVDVRWNWLAARNIAMKHAPEGFCLGTDMDHLVPAETAASLIAGNHDPEKIYRFVRLEHTGDLIHSHPNSWFMTRAMFWKFGGYDEALSGHYGTDGDARRRWVKTAPVRTLPECLVRYERIGDSSTTHYLRKQPEDRAVPDLIKLRGRDWKPKVLSFPYHEVQL